MITRDPPESSAGAQAHDTQAGVAAEPESKSTSYPLSRLAPRIELLDVAREIQESDRILGAVVGGQLEVIATQIRALQQQAKEILDRAKLSQELHQAECRFKKRPGAVYHLYRRANGSAYFSMLSPEE